MPTTTTNQVISALYVATFNRAPDKAGLTFWQQQFTQNSAAAVQELAAGFASHPAFTQLYGNLTDLAFVQAIYVNVLGQQGDAAGITFWNNLLANGTLTRSQFLAAFVESALTVDINSTNFPNLTQAELDAAIQRQDYLTNKADVGLYFTNVLGDDTNLLPTTNPNVLDGPNGLLADPAYQASIAILGGVTSDDASVLAAETLVDTAATQSDPIGYINDNALPPPGDTFILTTNVDTINPSSANAGDIVKGVVDGTADLDTGGATYTNGDTVNGNGNTVVELTVVEGGAAAIANLNDIADVNIVAGDTSSVTLNAVQWSSVGAVNLVRGASNIHDGLSIFVDVLEEGVDLSIASGVAGTLSASYQTGLFVGLEADKISSLSWINGDVDAVVAASESATFTAFMQTGDVTVGDINATVAKNGSFDAFVSSSGSGDITVGNVTIAAKTDASVSVSVSNNIGGSITVGDVSMLGGTHEFLGVFNQDATGDVSVGDVSMSVSATGTLLLDVSNTGTTGESLGSLTVGNIDLVIGRDAVTASVDIQNSNSYTTDGLSLGALTVGDMTIELGRDATLDVSISQSALGATANVLASFGDVQLGNLDATIGTNSFFSYDVFVNNSLSGDIASVAIGDVTLNLADGASVSYSVTVTAEKGDITSFVMGNVVVDMGVSATVTSFDIELTASNGGNIGTVVIGDLTANVGVNSDFDDYTLDVSATSGTIDSVTVGNVTAVVADGGSFSYTASVTAQAVGDVTFGDFDLTSHGAASLSVELSVSASAGDIGSVTVGDVSIVADGTSTVPFFSVSVSASDVAGVLAVGNISIETTKSSTASVDLFNFGGLIDGDITVGGLSLLGTDAITYDGANFIVGTAAYSGNISLGDISVGVSLTGITVASTAPSLDLTSILASVTTTGDITIGSVDYSALVLSWVAAATPPIKGEGVIIDLTTYKGNTSVIGSDYNDTIFDNTGINKLTGGDGADLFIFDPANTGKTLATMDQILDFNNTALDKMDVGVVPTVATYAEDTAASFAAFNTAANAANKEVFVGLVGGDGGDNLIVAVDVANDGNVDFMIQLVGLNNLNQIDIAAFV